MICIIKADSLATYRKGSGSFQEEMALKLQSEKNKLINMLKMREEIGGV